MADRKLRGPGQTGDLRRPKIPSIVRNNPATAAIQIAKNICAVWRLCARPWLSQAGGALASIASMVWGVACGKEVRI